jgi:hypothetical protein
MIVNEDLYLKALEEIESNKYDKGLWAKCFTNCNGDETKAKAAYIKKRVKERCNSFYKPICGILSKPRNYVVSMSFLFVLFAMTSLFVAHFVVRIDIFSETGESRRLGKILKKMPPQQESDPSSSAKIAHNFETLKNSDLWLRISEKDQADIYKKFLAMHAKQKGKEEKYQKEQEVLQRNSDKKRFLLNIALLVLGWFFLFKAAAFAQTSFILVFSLAFMPLIGAMIVAFIASKNYHKTKKYYLNE